MIALIYQLELTMALGIIPTPYHQLSLGLMITVKVLVSLEQLGNVNHRETLQGTRQV
jgi:hypothetical protein